MANLLQVQPELRYGAAEIKQDPWFDNISFEKLFLKQLEPPNFDWKPTSSVTSRESKDTLGFLGRLPPRIGNDIVA